MKIYNISYFSFWLLLFIWLCSAFPGVSIPKSKSTNMIIHVPGAALPQTHKTETPD